MYQKFRKRYTEKSRQNLREPHRRKKDVTKVKKTEIKIEKTEETKPIEEKKEEKEK